PELAAYAALAPALDPVCAAYARDALARLGWEPRPGDDADADALARRLGVAPRHRRLLGRLLEVLAEDGLLEPAAAPGAWLATAAWTAPPPDPQAALAALRLALPEAGPELELLAACGQALPEVLRGQLDPLQLLFPAGSTATLERLYRDTPPARLLNRLAREA